MQAPLTEFAALLSNAASIVLTTHVNPDGDGLGSELALGRFLRKRGKRVSILNHNETPENYRWMDPDGDLVAYVPDLHANTVRDADLIVIVDTNQPDRLRSLREAVEKSAAKKVIIDHHLDPHPFADLYVIDAEATSTGEIIYRVITHIDSKLLDRPMAQALYAAIMTDTGSFRFPRTDPEIHRIAAHLLELGVVPIEVYANVYEGWSQGRMRLLGEVLDSMKTAHDGKIAYVVCTQKMFRATGTSEVETDNFTTYPMSVRGVVVGILFNELHDGVKVSFRSKGSIPINELAKEFGGNGHLNAAGARVFGSALEEIVANVVARASAYVA